MTLESSHKHENKINLPLPNAINFDPKKLEENQEHNLRDELRSQLDDQEADKNVKEKAENKDKKQEVEEIEAKNESREIKNIIHKYALEKEHRDAVIKSEMLLKALETKEEKINKKKHHRLLWLLGTLITVTGAVVILKIYQVI